MGKVHGGLSRAGKVKSQTPKVPKQDGKKKPIGRAGKRMQYVRRFATGFWIWKGDGSNFRLKLVILEVNLGYLYSR